MEIWYSQEKKASKLTAGMGVCLGCRYIKLTKIIN